MNRRLAIAVGLAVLVAGFAVWWSATRTDRPSPLRIGENETPKVEEGPPPASPVEVDVAEPSLPADRGPLLHGTVTDLSGRPVDNARVLLRSAGDLSPLRERERHATLRARALGESVVDRPRVVAETAVDGEGRYAFGSSTLPGGIAVFDVLAGAPGMEPRRRRWVRSAESSRLDFRLAPGRSISGLVVDFEGQPVSGATVEAFDPPDGSETASSGRLVARTGTAGDGRFHLDVADGVYTLRAAASGFAPSELEHVLPSSDVLVTLDPGRLLAGTVRDPETRPLPGARVALYEYWWTEGTDLEAMVAETALQRRVLRSPTARATTDGLGRFEFRDLRAGTAAILIEMPGFRPLEETVVVLDNGEGTEIDVDLERAGTVRGRVIDEGESPVPGAFVVLSGPERRPGDWRDDPSEFLARALAVATTNGDGRFQVDTLAEAHCDLSVQAEGFATWREEGLILEGDAYDLEIVLERGLRLHGRVLSSLTGQPIPGATLMLKGAGGDVRTADADDGGDYEIGGLAAGDWTLIAYARGYSPQYLLDFEIPPSPESRAFDVHLDPGVTIAGHVVDASGRAVPGARVRVHERLPTFEDVEGGVNDASSGGESARADGRDLLRALLRHERRSEALAVETVTDGVGSFVLGDVTPGHELTLTVAHRDYREYVGEPFAASSDESIEGLRIELEKGGRLIVDVADHRGAIVSAARIRVRSLAPPEGGLDPRLGARRATSFRHPGHVTRTSNADGRAVFPGLASGTWVVVVEVRGYQPFASGVEVGEGDAMLSAVLLEENVIEGVVVDRWGAPVSGASLRAVATRSDARTGRRHTSRSASGDGGEFRLGSLGLGPYELQVERLGFAECRFGPFDVNTTQRLELQRTVSLRGRVLSESLEPVGPFSVRARLEGPPAVVGGDRDPVRKRFTDPEGTFVLRGLSPGTYRVEVSAEGFESREIEMDIREGESGRLEVRLPRAPDSE